MPVKLQGTVQLLLCLTREEEAPGSLTRKDSTFLPPNTGHQLSVQGPQGTTDQHPQAM